MSSELVFSMHDAFRNTFENFVVIYSDHYKDIRAIFDDVVDPLNVNFHFSISNPAKGQREEF